MLAYAAGLKPATTERCHPEREFVSRFAQDKMESKGPYESACGDGGLRRAFAHDVDEPQRRTL